MLSNCICDLSNHAGLVTKYEHEAHEAIARVTHLPESRANRDAPVAVNVTYQSALETGSSPHFTSSPRSVRRNLVHDRLIVGRVASWDFEWSDKKIQGQGINFRRTRHIDCSTNYHRLLLSLHDPGGSIQRHQLRSTFDGIEENSSASVPAISCSLEPDECAGPRSTLPLPTNIAAGFIKRSDRQLIVLNPNERRRHLAN